jgi:phage FluMu gp28-like protein
VTDLPAVFLPYQQRLWQVVDESALSVHEKSRRTGFSWALGGIAAATASAQRSAGGMDVLYMGYEKDMTREFIDYVAEWAKSMQLAASEMEEFVFSDPDRPDKSVGAFRIKFASGFEVIALPSVARALRGKQGLVILDEAAFMDDLDDVLTAALALLMWGGRVVVVSTHNGEDNAFNGLIQEIRSGRRRGVVTRTTLDEAIAEGLYHRICLVRQKTWSPEAEAEWRQGLLDTYRDRADEELHVIPNPTSGVYLPGPLLEARMVEGVPVKRWNAPKGFAMWPEQARVREVADFCTGELLPVLDSLDKTEPHVFGMDFALVHDLSVIWVLAIGQRLVRQSRLVIELRGTPHEQQRDILFYVLDRLPHFRAGKMDAGGNGSYLGQVTLQKYGPRVDPLQLSEPWYRDEMPPFKAAIEDAMLTLPHDREVIDDLRMLSLVRGVARIPQRRRTDEGAMRHGDAAIAGCLAHSASRMPVQEFGYETRPQAPSASGYSDTDDTWAEDNAMPGSGFLPTLPALGNLFR